MTSRPMISVCMATYNGASHVVEQLGSILSQLGPADVVVVVDDASRDGTPEAVSAIDDPRIRIVQQSRNRGDVATFAAAMVESRGDVLLLSDQDDVWPDGRLDALLAGLGDHDIAASNVVLLGSQEPLSSPVRRRPWLLSGRTSSHRCRNLARMMAGLMPYYGCTMALRRTALDLVLPFPEWLSESHDLWIATVGNVSGSLVHVEEPTVLRRVHATNASSSRPRGVRQALASRWLQVRMVWEAWRRARRV